MNQKYHVHLLYNLISKIFLKLRKVIQNVLLMQVKSKIKDGKDKNKMKRINKDNRKEENKPKYKVDKKDWKE